ncbi:MAG TPA: carbamoyl-phosphate synthase large subunit, partial [Polyangiaceae bacterium]|nr:carbamoyl-phosphate synthase large subunit [Polyangiaceae bacterium]
DYVALAAAPLTQRDLAMDAPPEPRAKETGISRSPAELKAALAKLVAIPTPDRLFYVADAMRAPVSMTDEELFDLTAIDPWFLAQIRRIVSSEASFDLSAEKLGLAKRLGFSDAQIAARTGSIDAVRQAKKAHGIKPVYRKVDTCAAEFVAHTPYLYSTHETENESAPTGRRKVIILGGGPNRIGQGIEFDYCCVHAVFALRELGFETVMVNCNPETVSTDYDTSDRLYFEPLTFEDVFAICQEESSKGSLEGVIVQFGGQTPLKLAVPLSKAGVKLLGTSADAIDRAEDRERFDELLSKLGLRRPRGGIARGVVDAFRVAGEIGYPVLVRPSYVLGGRAMMICHSDADLSAYVALAVEAAREAGTQTILVDEFLQGAIEVDVDSLCDGTQAVIGGVMQHIEEAGVHSGDSTSVLPPHSLPASIVTSIEEQTRQIAIELGVVGLMNVQFAVQDDRVYVLEVNPRASRTVPFVSKATGRPLAKIAAKVMAGKTLAELGIADAVPPKHVSVKESVFPFAKFPGVDTMLGPEMRSTGEVMGVSGTFGRAFGKALLAAGTKLPREGRAFISVRDDDKPAACVVARRLRALGFSIVATAGTAKALERAQIPAEVLKKVGEGSPHVVDAIRGKDIALVVNTTQGAKEVRDSYSLRRHTLLASIPYFTTMSAALAVVQALEAEGDGTDVEVKSLQEWHDGS